MAASLPIQQLVFQSTHPRRDATLEELDRLEISDISIHTSQTGCDVKGLLGSLPDAVFQSTHPRRDATGN